VRILVSVSDADEALDAAIGGADVVDAKDPSAGPLGAVLPSVLRDICHAVASTRPVSAALGDGSNVSRVESAAGDAAAMGARTVKLGFAGHPSASQVGDLLEAAVRGAATRGTPQRGDAHACGVFAVGYADWTTTYGPSPATLIDVAADAGAAGVLIDTADKMGPGLRALMDAGTLAVFVRDAHAAGLQVALAGKLRVEDLPFVIDVGADIAGVRGAACDGGRTGRLSVNLVRRLVQVGRGAVDVRTTNPAAHPAARMRACRD
jgi:uncharacterized protein (UPF0264 family)